MTQSELVEELIEVFGSEQRLADAIPPAGRRVILRWANGSQPVPVGAWLSISQALQGRQAILERLLKAVGQACAEANARRPDPVVRRVTWPDLDLEP